MQYCRTNSVFLAKSSSYYKHIFHFIVSENLMNLSWHFTKSTKTPVCMVSQSMTQIRAIFIFLFETFFYGLKKTIIWNMEKLQKPYYTITQTHRIANVFVCVKFCQFLLHFFFKDLLSWSCCLLCRCFWLLNFLFMFSCFKHFSVSILFQES